jgi:hypothetical protein
MYAVSSPNFFFLLKILFYLNLQSPDFETGNCRRMLRDSSRLKSAKSGRSQPFSIYSRKFLLLATITLVGVFLNFFALPKWRNASLSPAVRSMNVPSISQLNSIPWDTKVPGLPVKPMVCPRVYLAYEVRKLCSFISIHVEGKSTDEKQVMTMNMSSRKLLCSLSTLIFSESACLVCFDRCDEACFRTGRGPRRYP